MTDRLRNERYPMLLSLKFRTPDGMVMRDWKYTAMVWDGTLTEFYLWTEPRAEEFHVHHAAQILPMEADGLSEVGKLWRPLSKADRPSYFV